LAVTSLQYARGEGAPSPNQLTVGAHHCIAGVETIEAYP
jgi:hypothetical protein